MTTEPVRVFLSYSHEDIPLLDALAAHLRPMVLQGEITLWDVRTVRAGDDMLAVHERELERAQMIVPLISANFFASDNAFGELERAMKRRDAEGTLVVPILVRPCDWKPMLRDLQPLPRNETPVTRWEDKDEAWAVIVNEIRSILRFGAERVAPASAAAPPLHVRPISDIYRTFGQPDVTFVEPAQLPRLRSYLRLMGQGLVVEGPSGVGKTTVVKRALVDVQAAEQEWVLGQVESDRTKLDERLSAGFRGHLIIDDFHRLDRPRQVRVADAMKIIADRDTRDAKITVIGINPVGDSLVGALRDLAGRFEVVAMGRQPDEKVAQLIGKGEEAAHILFRRRDEFILAAAGSFFTAQHLCYEAAMKAGVEETTPTLTYVDVGFRDVVDTVVANLDSKYFGDLRVFACHDDRTPPRGACLALLWLLSQSKDGHVTLDDVHYRFADADVRAALTLLKTSYLSKCFEEAPELKTLFYYNKNAGVLSIEDPRLTFYLRNMSWPGFITRTNHRHARIDAEGNLVFTRREPSEPPPPARRLVNVLHLSDLHFTQIAQAGVWYGQLAEDLKEMECEHVDVLILSGDLTQRAEKTELEAMRRFLLRLSTEFRLSPGQVVMVPGNHDLSWSLSRSAYSLHRRAEVPGVLEEGTFVAHGTEVVETRDDDAYRRRFEPFADLYGQIKGSPYPLDYAEQFDVQDFAKENLLFVGLNSSWQIDHHFPSRASIHPEALARALGRLRQSSTYRHRVKIAVFHHPLAGAGEDRLRDHGFMEQLAKAGFRLVLHGHIHKAETGLYRYDMAPDGRRIDVVSAGTFGAPTRDWVPGYPLQYNLIQFSSDNVVVTTRKREEPNGAWQPDARWLQGAGKDPLPRYEIALV